MNKKVVSVLFLAMFSSVALATSGNSNNNNSSTTGTIVNTPTASSSATGVGIGVSNSRSNSNSVSRATAQQGQRQGQQQGQRQTATGGTAYAAGGVSVAQGGAATTADSNNSTQVINQNSGRRPVSSAMAPTILPTAPCTGGVAVGAQGAGFGLSLGGSSRYEDCMRQEKAKTVFGFGDAETAEEIMCDDADYRHARARTGRPCATREVTAEEAKVYSGTDPVVRARLGLQPLN